MVNKLYLPGCLAYSEFEPGCISVDIRIGIGIYVPSHHQQEPLIFES